jgi:hypothetical protein
MKVELPKCLKRGNRNKKQAVRVIGILCVAHLGTLQAASNQQMAGE